MAYDFDRIIDRAGKDALAVDTIPMEGAAVKEGFDRIPMWVADMNFATAPAVQEAVSRRLEHPCFGYFSLSEEYFDAILRWQRLRNGVEGLRAEHIGYENGVLGGLLSALRAAASPGEEVLVHAPTYIGFTRALENAGYRIAASPLRLDGGGIWRMDYRDMEETLQKRDIRTAILCSPHNPCGRVWERGELEEAMALFRKYDCTVLSDEIWSDLILEGRHIPTQSVSADARERTAAFYAPSKTFNLAGLVGAYHIVYNQRLRRRMEKESSLSHYNECNVLSMHALVGAYSDEGAQWVDELRGVLRRNVDRACDFFARVDGVRLARPQGTYMLFLDCQAWCARHEKTLDDLLRAGIAVGVIWQDGRPFRGPYSIRMNLALPPARVQEALRRLEEFVF